MPLYLILSHIPILTNGMSVLRYSATSLNVAGSRPDEVNEFFQFNWSFQPHYGPGVYSALNRNAYQKQKNVSGE
jgi:hypothetical protein